MEEPIDPCGRGEGGACGYLLIHEGEGREEPIDP